MTVTDEQTHQNLMMKTGMLVEALPFMRRYSGKTILVKFGGHAMGKSDYVAAFASDIALLDQVGARPVVVHGGGPQIGEMLDRLKIKSNFIDGLRVTDEATISVVEMVLAGGINKALVAAVMSAGGRAVGDRTDELHHFGHGESAIRSLARAAMRLQAQRCNRER